MRNEKDRISVGVTNVINICQQGLRKDFIDLYLLLQDIPFHRVASHLVAQYGPLLGSPISISIGKSLVYFADAEVNLEPACIKGKAVKWEDVKIFFRQHVKQFVLDLDVAVKKGNK